MPCATRFPKASGSLPNSSAIRRRKSGRRATTPTAARRAVVANAASDDTSAKHRAQHRIIAPPDVGATSKWLRRFAMTRARDTLTADLFDIPRAAPALPGSINFSREIAAAMSAALKACPADRIEVAARMTRLMGREITLSMLNAYTAESHVDHNISLERAIAFDIATDSQALLSFFAAKSACSILVGEDALLAEMGRIQKTKDELTRRERALRARIRGQR